MFKCKDGECPLGKDMCCMSCNDQLTCENVCEGSKLIECKDRIEVPATVIPFEMRSHELITKMCSANATIVEMESKLSDLRANLEMVMGEYGIKSFENEMIKITYVPESVRKTVDSARLKKELPEIAEKYTKESPVKASVRITYK